MRANLTKQMQPRIQAARAVSREEAVGVDETAELNMFTNTFVCGHFLVHWFVYKKCEHLTRSVVSRRPQRAGWADGGIRKLISDTKTKRPCMWNYDYLKLIWQNKQLWQATYLTEGNRDRDICQASLSSPIWNPLDWMLTQCTMVKPFRQSVLISNAI